MFTLWSFFISLRFFPISKTKRLNSVKGGKLSVSADLTDKFDRDGDLHHL